MKNITGVIREVEELKLGLQQLRLEVNRLRKISADLTNKPGARKVKAKRLLPKIHSLRLQKKSFFEISRILAQEDNFPMNHGYWCTLYRESLEQESAASPNTEE